jgi:thiamine-phosphate pyrophosphorylase
MTRRPRRETQAPAPRLYLVTPPVEDPAGLAPVLSAALAAADVSAVLLRLTGADERVMIDRVRRVAPIVQERGTALLLAGHAGIAAAAGADGAHLDGVDAFMAARALLKPGLIAGAGGLASRHDAMVVGEAGADYVMFGDPDLPGLPPPPARVGVAERVAWWAELFEPPCIGYAYSLEDVGIVAAAGADFVAVGEVIWNDPRGAAAAIRAAAAQLSSEPVP